MFLAVCSLGSGLAAARDIYVSNRTGNDSLDGSAPRREAAAIGPVRTLARALHMADKGDRIVVERSGRPYYESISLSGVRHRGAPGRPLTIQGNGATLDGTTAIPADQWQYYRDDVFRFRPRRITHQRLLLHGKPAEQRPLDFRRVVPELAPLQWALVDQTIYLRVEHGKLPHDYEPRYSGLQTGITLYNVDHVRINNLVVEGFQLDGVNAHDGVRNTQLDQLICRANGRSGISVGGASHLKVDRCELHGNGRSQFRMEGVSTVWLNGTQIDATTAPSILVEGGRLLIDGKPFRQDPAVGGR